MALYDVEDGISRGLWTDSSLSDIKGKKPFVGSRPADVSVIGSSSQRPLRRHQPIPQFPEPHSSYASHQALRDPRFLHGYRTAMLCCSVHCETRSAYPRPRAQQTSAPFALRAEAVLTDRHAVESGSSEAYRGWGPGHETDRCTALRHAIQDLIDQGLVHLGQPSVTTNPLPAHTTHAVPPPADAFISWNEWGDSGPSDPAPFRLVPEAASVQAATVEPLILPRYSIQTPFVLVPDVEEFQAPHSDDPQTPDEEVRAEDDEILRQLQSTQARISIWSLLASSSTHRDALTRALSQIRVDTTTTPEGLIHMMTARSLFLAVMRLSVFYNGSALNVCPLATAIALGYAPSDFGPSTQTVRAYDSTRREVMGTLEIELLIAGAIPSSLHQKVKFIHEGQVVVVQSAGDMFISAEPVLQISHSDDDLLLTGFTFDEACLSTRHGIGRRQHGPSEFITIPDHDVPFGLGFIPTEADYRHMARLRRERVRARLTHTPFYYPVRPYTMSLADYFVRASEPHAPSDGIIEDSAPLRRPSFSASSHEPYDALLPDEIDDHGTFAEIGDVVDGAVPRDEYIAEEIQVAPTPEVVEDVIVAVDLFDGPVGLVEGASDLVDPPLTFDVLSGFVSRHDYVSDFSSMDLSTFEYLPVSHVIDLSAPSSPTSQIFDIDDEIAQHDSDDDSSSASDSDPVDQRVSPAVGDTEIVDFGTADQPRELRIDRICLQMREIASSSYSDPTWTFSHGPMRTCQALIHLSSSIVKEEIQKQLSVGFLSVVEYPEWLANVVPVPKKDGKVRVCVDFRDLNKASPKDDFPLPHIDMLVDSTAGHSMLSFMDGFSGYSQILMAPEDMEKTSFITEWGTYCYRVMPFGLKNAGATYQRAATTLFHDMMHRDVEVYVDDMIVKSRDRSDHLAALESERGIEVDPDKIRAILDMPAPRTEREVRGFLGRLHASVLRRIRGVLVVTSCFGPPTPGRPLLLYLSVSDVALGCMLAQLDDSGKDRAIYYLSKRMLDYETRPALVGRLMRWLVLLTEFDIHYVTQKSIRGSIVADHLASLPVSDARAIDDDFPDEDVAAVTSLSGWRISVRLAFSDRHPATNNIVEYEACILGLETPSSSGLDRWRAQNQFADALATLASMIDIPVDATVRPLLIESRSAPAYCCLIDDVEPDDGLPWYHDIYHFLRLGVYPEAATAKDKRALRQLATRFVICGETLYSPADHIWEDICWLIHGDLIHVPPSELQALTSPWPFSVWGIDIIGKISPKSSSGHEFILVAIDYFTKWVEAASYARLTSAGVASFIRSHIIFAMGVPHELISDRGVHFRAEVDTLYRDTASGIIDRLRTGRRRMGQ
ncbi:Transposon Ty3-I Gag-Pol polyprotein [Vitis vinifera]|uniref:Transposon Ty3-I Gag-Pol polyprotein n=1 Tax=Vitis vinifera TaxID=29760 RepID=A0A438I2R7_VITVI|nr:Transposon Ty3-I Gag-Pol polyprotein [Vitis vinifera]